jgi:hypothetical protein
MASPTTSNTVLNPGAGWVQLPTDSITYFLRLTKFPSHVPVYLYFGASAPAGQPSGGFRWDSGCTWFNGPITGNLYARIQNNSNGPVTVSVFSN